MKVNILYNPACGRCRSAILVSLAIAAAAFPAYAQHEGHNTSKMGNTDNTGNMPGMAKDAKTAPMSRQPITQSMMPDVRELKAQKGEGRERTFLTKMMNHHQGGIDMAKLALQKSQNPAIRSEAQRIISSQTKEIGEMRQHLSSAHKTNRSAKPDPRMRPMMRMLQGMSGTEFDKAFARDMGMHHQGAISMAEVIVTSGVPHPAVRAMAEKTIKGNRKSQQNLEKAAS